MSEKQIISDDLFITIARNNDMTRPTAAARFYGSIIKGRDGLWFWQVAVDPGNDPTIQRGFATRAEAASSFTEWAASELEKGRERV